VTITGPPKRSNKLRKSRTKKDINGTTQAEARSFSLDTQRKTPKSAQMEVRTEKTFEVSETFQEPNPTWGSISQQPLRGASLEADIERAAGGLKDWSSLETPDAVEAYGDYEGSERRFDSHE